MWDFFGELWSEGLRWSGSLLDNMAQGMMDGLQGLGGWLSQTFGAMFEAVTGFLSAILQPFLDLIGGIGYLLTNLVDVIILVIQVFLLLVQVAVAVIGGLLRSFAALSLFNPATVTVDHNPFGTGTALIFDVFARAGGDVLAGVLSWAVWFVMAVAIIRLFARDRATS